MEPYKVIFIKRETISLIYYLFPFLGHIEESFIFASLIPTRQYRRTGRVYYRRRLLFDAFMLIFAGVERIPAASRRAMRCALQGRLAGERPPGFIAAPRHYRPFHSLECHSAAQFQAEKGYRHAAIKGLGLRCYTFHMSACAMLVSLPLGAARSSLMVFRFLDARPFTARRALMLSYLLWAADGREFRLSDYIYLRA